MSYYFKFVTYIHMCILCHCTSKIQQLYIYFIRSSCLLGMHFLIVFHLIDAVDAVAYTHTVAMEASQIYHDKSNKDIYLL
jgi:hypothetical protein